MPDWSKSMQQTYEYYIVDPNTWKDEKQISNITSSKINWDSEAETLGSATIDITESLGECYIRIYLVTIQNGVKERHPLATVLVQTPSYSFDGKVETTSMDAYMPLIELKENMPPIGYSLLRGDNIMEKAYILTKENVRAPVVEPSCVKSLYNNFVSDPSDTWIAFLTDLISNAEYTYGIDEMGRVLFLQDQDAASLQPVWTYTDDNSSILYPEIDIDRDLYGIPNVVEVVYSNNNDNYYAKVVNNDPNSTISTVNRGREIVYRVTDPDLAGDPTGAQIQEYAEKVLRAMSTLEYTVSYKHGYCPVRLGDCVRLNYEKAGLTNIKAKVISQSIDCVPGCPVTEKATFTIKLWR